MTASRAELLKWVGLASMLVDHAARYLHLVTPGWLWIGRFAFPCFAISLGVQVATDSRLRVAGRLLLAALVVFPLQFYASGVPVGSVLATLALGLLVAWAAEDASVHDLPLLALCLLGSLFVEYGAWGVLLVAGVSLLLGSGESLWVAFVAIPVGVVGLVVRGGEPVAFALGCVTLYAMWGGVSVPRVKGIFLQSYFIQWVALCGARLFL